MDRGMKPYYPVEMQWAILQKFGENKQTYPKRHGHPGLDFATPVGCPVYAVADGKIKLAEYRESGGYGREIDLVFGNWHVIYGHLSKIDVHAGDTVKRGDILGYTGGALSDPYRGMSTEPHLHFEVRDLTQPQVYPLIGAVDPEIWLNDETISQPLLASGGDTVTVVSNHVNIRRIPTTSGNEPIGQALYGMDFVKAGPALPGTGTVKGWQPVIVYIATGQADDGDYLE